jgi:hypothetical protein
VHPCMLSIHLLCARGCCWFLEHATLPPHIAHHTRVASHVTHHHTPQAIKSREDVIERLKVACDKLGASLGGSAPLALSPTDPLVRLLYRCGG